MTAGANRVCGHAGPGVEEGRKVVTKRRLVQDDVVRPAAVDLVEVELGLRPVNAIAAFAIAGDFHLVPIALGAASIAGVEAEQIAVFDHRAVFEVVGRLTHRGSKLRLVQLELRSFFLSDQKPIDK